MGNHVIGKVRITGKTPLTANLLAAFFLCGAICRPAIKPACLPKPYQADSLICEPWHDRWYGRLEWGPESFWRLGPHARWIYYRENFISEAEEQKLIREIQKLQLTPFKYYQFTGKRRTVSFGWQYEFGASEITAAIDPNSLVQTSIIEDSTGSPIGWHRDIPYFGVVVGLSLARRAE